MKTRRRFSDSGPGGIIAALIIAALGANTFGANDGVEKRLGALVDKGAVMCMDENGTPLVAINPSDVLVPASIFKILTSLIALETLGDDYRFKTEFYADGKGGVCIKGWGDPYLISEEIDTISAQLARNGLTEVRRLYLDQSTFAADITIPGVSRSLNPYDAINGALVVNFNTINVGKDAKGIVYSGEPVTPLTPLARTKAAVIPNRSSQRINLTKNKLESVRYAGELFCALLSKNGVTVAENALAAENTPAAGELLYVHQNTRTLSTVVKGLMKYSNNFIANQIFLTVGAINRGYPASLPTAVSFFNDYALNQLELPAEEFVIAEGSGISRMNKVTAQTMVQALELFRDYADLLPLYKGALVKSGTLSGVYNYAGYIRTGKGLRPFVIMLNQKRNTRDAVLKLLVEHFGA